jgi:hypothetical protein
MRDFPGKNSEFSKEAGNNFCKCHDLGKGN